MRDWCVSVINKLLRMLFFVQLIILAIFSVAVINMTNIINLIDNGKTAILLTSPDGITTSERDIFLSILSQEGIGVSRHIYTDRYNMNLYTSNTSIGDRLPTNGRTPTLLRTNPVASAIEYLIFDFYERLNVNVFDINTFSNFNDGTYLISTTNQIKINNLLKVLYENEVSVDQGWVWINDSTLLETFLRVSFLFLTDFAELHIFIFLCVFIVLIQYAVSQLKFASVLLIHGVSIIKLSKKIAIKMMKIFIVPCILSICIFFSYGLWVIGYRVLFMFQLSFYFLVACLFLMIFYMMVICFVITLCLFGISTNNILKGRRPFYFVRISNHILRILFFIFLFTALNQILIDIDFAQTRMSLQNEWERARYIYRIRPSLGTFTPDNLEREFIIFDDLVQTHEYLTKNYNAFIMNSQNFLGREIFESSSSNIPEEPNLFMYLRVSPNYFYFNPIFTINNLPVEDELIIDSNVLNIIVPIGLEPFHDVIFNEYLNLFYFNKVRVDNIYNHEFGLPLNTTPIEELYVNIIYARDDQTYFTFNTMIRLEENINIVDPIVIIYTGSEHSSFLFSDIQSHYFVQLTTPELTYKIESHLDISGLSRNITWFSSVYDENARNIVEIHAEYVRNIAFLILLLIISLIISYILVMSFVGKNRYELHVKYLFGHAFWKRSKGFLLNMVIYTIITSFITISMLGFSIIFLLIFFYTLDLLIYAFIENVSIVKSHNEVIKGERL